MGPWGTQSHFSRNLWFCEIWDPGEPQHHFSQNPRLCEIWGPGKPSPIFHETFGFVKYGTLGNPNTIFHKTRGFVKYGALGKPDTGTRAPRVPGPPETRTKGTGQPAARSAGRHPNTPPRRRRDSAKPLEHCNRLLGLVV